MSAKYQERLIQCGYHLGSAVTCRLVELTPGGNEWQYPKWVCAPCRKYLTGRWRYFQEKVNR